jgi:hypothetical protein
MEGVIAQGQFKFGGLTNIKENTSQGSRRFSFGKKQKVPKSMQTGV